MRIVTFLTTIALVLVLTSCNQATINYDISAKSRTVGSASANPPSLDPLSDETVSEGTPVTALDLSDSGDDRDIDGDILTYSCVYETLINGALDSSATNCSSLPGSVSFDTLTGIFHWTPSFQASGTYEVWFRASDGYRTDSQVVTYTITNVNQPPVIDVLPTPVKVFVTSTYSINLGDGGDDADVDNDPLTYGCVFETVINGAFNGPGTNCSSLSGVVSFNSTTGAFSWTPNLAASGVYELWFTASDGSLTSSRMIALTVEDNSLGDFSISGVTGGGDTVQDNKLNYVTTPVIHWGSSAGAASYDVQIYNDDGATPVACGSATVASTSYNFSTCALTPGAQYKVRVTARTVGGGGKNATNDLFNFRLNNPPVATNDGPYYILANGSISVSVLTDNLATVAYDPDSDLDADPITIASRTNGTKGTTTISGNNVVYTASAGQVGMDTFTYTISDGRGGSATGTVTIYIISGYTWLGAVDSDWNNPGNWCGSINSTKTSCSGGSTLPTSADVVNFNSSCINCNVSVTSNIDVLRVNIDADFPGTISQNANTIRVRSGWTQNGGTFDGGSANILIVPYLRISGGTFHSTSGELEISRDQGCCGATTDSFVIHNASGFNHRNGTVRLSSSSANGTGHHVKAFELNVPGGATFYNLVVRGIDVDAAGGYDNTITALKSGQTISVLNKYTQEAGRFELGKMNLYGDAEFLCSSPTVCSGGGGTPYDPSIEITFLADFPIVQTLRTEGTAATPSITISGTGTVNTVSSTNDLIIVGNFKQTDGVFNAPSGWIRMWSSSISYAWDNLEGFRLLGGTFVNNGFSLALHGWNGNSAAGTPRIGTIEVPLGFEVNNFQFDHYAGQANSFWELGTNLINVNGDFTISDGRISGAPTFIIDGNVTFECVDAVDCAENTDANLVLMGSGTQTVTQAPGAGVALGHWTIDSASSVVSLAGHLTLNGAGQDLDLLNGTLNMNGFNLTIKDGTAGGNILTLGPNTLINRGTTPGTIDTDTIVQDPSAVINPP